MDGFAINIIVSVIVNYIVKCFYEYVSESAIIMGLYRLLFSLTVSFFVFAWMGKVKTE